MSEGEDREDEVRLLRAERDSWYGTCEQLVVERDRLREALEQIAQHGNWTSDWRRTQRVARAALAGSVSDKDREPER